MARIHFVLLYSNLSVLTGLVYAKALGEIRVLAGLGLLLLAEGDDRRGLLLLLLPIRGREMLLELDRLDVEL